MNFKEALSKLEDSSEFKEWFADNSKSYLVHGFIMFDEKRNPDAWQIGFYSTKRDTITTFRIEDQIIKNPESEAFKKEGDKILELDSDKVKIDIAGVLERVDELQQKEYKAHDVFKTVVILQNLPDKGQVWNVTFVTKTFQTLNIKVNAESGEIIDHKMVSIIQDMQPGKKK